MSVRAVATGLLLLLVALSDHHIGRCQGASVAMTDRISNEATVDATSPFTVTDIPIVVVDPSSPRGQSHDEPDESRPLFDKQKSLPIVEPIGFVMVTSNDDHFKVATDFTNESDGGGGVQTSHLGQVDNSNHDQFRLQIDVEQPKPSAASETSSKHLEESDIRLNDQQQKQDMGMEWIPEGDKVHGGCQEDGECARRGIHVAVSSSEGLTIPEGINLTLRCTVTAPLSMTPVSIDWHTIPAGRDTSSPPERIHVSEETFEQSAKGTLTVISTLRVINVTSDGDSRNYVCSASGGGRDSSDLDCCPQTATVNVHVYVPPTHATDFAIVCVVCFLEFIIILYCKTKNARNSHVYRSDPENGGCAGPSRPDIYLSSSEYEPIPRTSKEAELKEQQVKT